MYRRGFRNGFAKTSSVFVYQMEYVLFKEGMISYDSGDGSVADPDVAGL